MNHMYKKLYMCIEWLYKYSNLPELITLKMWTIIKCRTIYSLYTKLEKHS